MFEDELLRLRQLVKADSNRFVDICNERFILINFFHYWVFGFLFLIYICLQLLILGTIGMTALAGLILQ